MLTFINIKIVLIIILSCLLCLSCKQQVINHLDDGKMIAKINESELYSNEIQKIVPSYLSKNDSVEFVKSYINRWAGHEVFYQQALIYLTNEEQDIAKQLEDYKKELIAYKFQIKLINDKLDTNITASQIEEYYSENIQNFLLKNNIVKVLYVKTPLNIPKIENLKKLCYSSSPKDAEALNALCVQYANNYYMNDNTWLMFDDLKKEIPKLKEVPDYSLQNGKTFEFTDASSFYFLKIIELKIKNTISPLNFEKNNIKNMLINQRKQKLINAIKIDFFNKAIINKELKIYN